MKNSLEMQEELIIDSLMEGEVVSIILPIKQSQTLRMNMKNARILEVDPKSDKYEIKLAYRKMAKKYHPDLNKEEGATKKFQEINSAFEFFTDENIERYRKMIDINK